MDQLNILIDNRQKKSIATQTIHQKTKQILNALGFDAHELSVVITSDEEIRQLNRTYRNKDKATNVLAFPMQEGEFSQITPGLLGDVVVSVETAQKEALAAEITLEERMSQLLIHGILHLCGFDHEKGEDAASDMENKSLEILRIIEPNRALDVF